MGHPDQLLCVSLVHVVFRKSGPCQCSLVELILILPFSSGLFGRKLRLLPQKDSTGPLPFSEV